jgi:hypothetical protein
MISVANSTIPVAARFKAWVHDISLAGIVGLNPASGVDVCPCECCELYRNRSLLRADHPSRGVLPSVCVCVCVLECGQVQQ